MIQNAGQAFSELINPSTKTSWQYRFKTRLGRSALAGDAVPLLLAILVGLITGLGAYVFIVLLGEASHLMGQIREQWGVLAGLVLMIGAGVVTGLIISRFALEAKGHGVPEVMEAIVLKRGRIRPRVAIAKIIASTITIGSGGSAGREGPIVQVGSTLGSTAGQWANVSDEQVGMLVASGAAAGIAATFNAPIAGTLFALEVIMGRFTNRYLSIVVLSAVSANVVSRMLLGENPAFAVPAYGLNSPLELPLYLILGVLCALVAILFIRTLYGAEHFFDHWDIPFPIKTGIGLGLTGAIGILAPDILGPGLEFIGETIAEDLPVTINVMLLFIVLKLLATTFTLGSGNSGGVFAPGLFMGAMVGGVIGQLGAQMFPDIVVEPGAFALVGMAALFAGAARAPITAIIIVLEMSNDYRLILPLLMTVIISTLITELLHPDSIYTRKLALRGIQVERGHDVDLLQAVRVEEVMRREYPTVSPQMTLKELVPRFNLTHSHGFPIVDDKGHLKGIVTLTDLEHVYSQQNIENRTVAEIGTMDNIITVFPDDPIYLALRRMNIYDIGRLPIITRNNSGKYMGMIQRADVIRAYEIGLARKSIEQYQQEHFNLRQVEENEFIEVLIEPGAPMVGHTMMEFPCSDNCLIISIRRGGQTFIAHGDTVIRPGDLVTAYVYPEALDEVMAQFTPQRL